MPCTRAVAGAKPRIGEPVQTRRTPGIVGRVFQGQLRKLCREVGDAGREDGGDAFVQLVRKLSLGFGCCERRMSHAFDGIAARAGESLVQRSTAGTAQAVVGRRAEQRVSRPHHPRPADHGRLVNNDHPCRNCPLNRLGVRVRRAETPGGSRRGDELGNIWPQVADTRIDQRLEPDRHWKRAAGLGGDLKTVQGPGQFQGIERVAAGGLVNPQQQWPRQPDTAASLQQREKGTQRQRPDVNRR